jgi:hypothetical protein
MKKRDHSPEADKLEDLLSISSYVAHPRTGFLDEK